MSDNLLNHRSPHRYFSLDTRHYSFCTLNETHIQTKQVANDFEDPAEVICTSSNSMPPRN